MDLGIILIPFVVMFITSLFLFPALYLLDIIRDRMRSESKMRDLLLILFVSYLLSMVVYTLSVPEQYLPFGSSYASYGIVLALIFVIYLMVFNKTK